MLVLYHVRAPRAAVSWHHGGGRGSRQAAGPHVLTHVEVGCYVRAAAAGAGEVDSVSGSGSGGAGGMLEEA